LPEPLIYHTDAVLSGITPILRKVNTRELTVHFTCPVILGFEYAAKVIFTMFKRQ
jgi:hypothetical protein